MDEAFVVPRLTVEIPPDFTKLVDGRALTDYAMGLYGWQVREHASRSHLPSPTLAKSLKQYYNKRKQTLYIRSWVDNKLSNTGGFYHQYEAGFYGMTQASVKPVMVRSRTASRVKDLTSLLHGTNVRREARALDSKGHVIKGEGYKMVNFGNLTSKKVAQSYGDLATFKAFRVENGYTKSGKKKYKTMYNVTGWNQGALDRGQYMRFQINGEWKTIAEYQANSPKNTDWLNKEYALLIYRSDVIATVDKYVQKKLDAAIAEYKGGTS